MSWPDIGKKIYSDTPKNLPYEIYIAYAYTLIPCTNSIPALH